jgi:hypothetical protein
MNAFNPVNYSDAENDFLLKHLGEPSVIALRDIRRSAISNPHPREKNPFYYPEGVNPASVKPLLDRIYELEQLQKIEGTAWIGVEKMKAAIKVWQRENSKWKRDYLRTSGKAPRWPSLYSFDMKGRPRLGGPGSDSGQVRTYFGTAGERIPFEISLFPEFDQTWVAPGLTEVTETAEFMKVDPEAHRIECRIPLAEGGICGHTESYKEDSRASYNAARARFSKHLRKATKEVDAHRELHTNEFGA